MAKIFSPLVKSYFIQRNKKFQDSKNNPILYQKNILKGFIDRAKYTVFGQKYDIKSLSESDYSKRIPVHTYQDILPYIEQIQQGQKDVLWPGQVSYFAESSGTTSDKKYIPITKEALFKGHYKAGRDVLSSYYMQFPNTNIYKGKHFILTGSFYRLNAYQEAGDLSSVILKKLPRWVESRRAVDKDIALLSSWDEKIERISKQLIQEDITILAGVPSWIAVVIETVQNLCKTKDITEIWPNMELYLHGGVSFCSYEKIFANFFKKQSVNYVENYNATEGFFASKECIDSKGMTLFVGHGIYYEFLPFVEYLSGGRKTIPLEEVELHTEYVMIITTNTGLWRYLLDDVITFVHTYPFEIKIIGRTNFYINCFGEEMSVYHVNQAISNILTYHDCIISYFTVCPFFEKEHKGSGGHEWLFSFHKRPDIIDTFIRDLDMELQKCNIDYKAKRSQNILMKPIRYSIVEEEKFIHWLKKHNKIGAQAKIPVLSQTREILDSIKYGK